MPKLPSLTAKEIITVLYKIGFKCVRQRGSHMFFEHPDGRKTVLPNHQGENIGPGLLIKIIKQDLLLTKDEFIDLL